MARQRGDVLAGGLGRRPVADQLGKGIAFSGSVYPSKGKGYGVQGEAAYPDLLAKWDKDGHWQSWRKGMALAQAQLVGAAERFTAVRVEHRDSFATTQQWRTSTLLLAGFTSQESPEGRWTVAIQPRGTEITAQPVGAAQKEFWYRFEDEPGRAPLRLLELDFKATAARSVSPLHFNRMLVGEVLEDTAISGQRLEDDLTAGIGLLCVAVHEAEGKVYFDATRFWRRERTTDGRLITREVPVAAGDPLPTFRPGRHLTQATTVSCNCPAHLGMSFVQLRSGPRLGSQDLFPQRAPSGLGGPQRSAGEGDPEGVRRRFRLLPWDRIPGAECKHCHAVRWALGAPMAEPSDMQSLASDYWNDMRVMGRIEEMDAPLSDPRFLDDLRLSLLNEQAFSMLDVTLLAACVGDCVGIVPQRVELSPVQLLGGRAARAAVGVLRLNEQHPTTDPIEDVDAVFGDWWVGRGTATEVLGFDGPSKPRSSRAIEPLPPGSTDLPTAIP
ncbi:MAG: hypothetical protein LW834_07055 [Cyanobium sp. 49614_E6]|nr:hypothetical protein [Cyanobium sp. 49614_E6]